MSEISQTDISKDEFDSVVLPQCKKCVLPKLLRDSTFELGFQRNTDWPKTREAYAGYIALCQRTEEPRADDRDPCIDMIQDRRCYHENLSSLDKTGLEAKAEEIILTVV